MPKIFDLPDHELIGYERLNENTWFEVHQRLLLEMVKTRYGRDLLCVDQSYKDIVSIGKNRVIRQIGKNEYVADFRVGAKWANVVRYRWDMFKEYARYFPSSLRQQFFVNNKVLVPQYMNDSATFFPDPHVESTSVDGKAANGVDADFATIRAGAGDDSRDDQGIENLLLMSATVTTDVYSQNHRSFFLFDTSSMDDAAVVSAGTLDIWVTSAIADGLGGTHSASVVDTNPASNTAIVDADYGNSGTTQQAGDIAFGSLSAGGYQTFTLNSTGEGNIDVSGITKFGLRTDYDRTNTAPTWASGESTGFNGETADTTGTNKDPLLTVTFSFPLPAGGSPYIYNYYY